MSRITGVTLLLVILVVSFYHSTASRHRLKSPIHVCGCTVRPNGNIWCLKQQRPNGVNRIEDLGKCLCSQPDQLMFETACRLFRKSTESQHSHIHSYPL